MPVYGYLLELREMLSAVNLMPWIGRLNWFWPWSNNDSDDYSWWKWLEPDRGDVWRHAWMMCSCRITWKFWIDLFGCTGME